MSKPHYNSGDLGDMRMIEDEKGEVFISISDIITHLEGNKHRMNEIKQESITADRFISLLKTFEKSMKDDPNFGE